MLSNSSLLSSYQILKRSRHFCDNINIFQCIEGVYWKQCSRFVFIKDCLPSLCQLLMKYGWYIYKKSILY
jgi:hypothetical protein